jgi:sulfide:quinone oxidoreductase
VVIAGGGVAAIEALLALRAMIGHQVEITLVTPAREFVYRPVTVAEAFDRAEAHAYPTGEIVSDQDAELIPERLTEVGADHHVGLESGRRLAFDKLVVAVGAGSAEPLPGALTFRGREDVPALRQLLDELVEGRAGSLALALPSPKLWSLPLYELALMTAEHLREHGASQVAITLVTPEDEPLELFGPAAGEAIRALLAAQTIELRTSAMPATVHEHALALAGGGVVFVDRVITLPRPIGPALPGLPHDPQGFIPVDRHGRVSGAEDVFAAGDVTAFPIKQGGLAAQQADAAAEAIAADLGDAITPRPFRPVLRGLLMTGGAPLYLRAEPHRQRHEASVAIEAEATQRRPGPASAAADQPLWWPPAKIAGRYLAPYLATARPQPLSGQLMADRVPIAGPAPSDSESQDALELALMLARLDARWGDYRSALEALDAAEALEGALPPEYEARRREWRAAARTSG